MTFEVSTQPVITGSISLAILDIDISIMIILMLYLVKVPIISPSNPFASNFLLDVLYNFYYLTTSTIFIPTKITVLPPPPLPVLSHNLLIVLNHHQKFISGVD